MRCSNKIKFICEDEAVAVELISFLKKCSLNPSCTIPALASLVNSLKLEGCSLACEEGMFYDPEEATTVFRNLAKLIVSVSPNVTVLCEVDSRDEHSESEIRIEIENGQ